jgi:hypothetical protein
MFFVSDTDFSYEGKLLYPNDPAWPDMEYVLYSQNPDHFFYGGVLKSLDEAYRKYHLAFGSKLGQNACKSFTFHKSSRMFQNLSMLSPLLEGRMTGWSDHTNESVDKLANSLNAVLRDKASKGRLARQLGTSPDWVKHEIDTRRMVRLFEDAPADGPPALLRDLSLFLEGEIQTVFFDWIAMYRICGDIWKDVISELLADPALEKLMRNPNPGIGYYVIKMAAADEAERGSIALDDPDLAPQLRKVWSCIQKTILKRSSHEFNPRQADKEAWLCDECLAHQFDHASHCTAWQSVESNADQLLDFYRNWSTELKHESGVIDQICGSCYTNELPRERDTDLLMGGLRAPCIMDEHHTEDCGRCRRRNFFLEQYGTASSLRGTELVERHLGRKYHGKDEEKTDENAGLKAVLKNIFASRGIPFFDSDNGEGWSDSDSDEDAVYIEHDHGNGVCRGIRQTSDGKYEVKISVRNIFSKPGVWTSLVSPALSNECDT